MEISITGMGSVSPLGNSYSEIINSYKNQKTTISFENEIPKATLSQSSSLKINELRNSLIYRDLDNSVLYAIAAARKAVCQANWNTDFGINIGSSRGATSLFEEHFTYFLENQKCKTLASPTTTLGNISSWVAQDLKATGVEISHSITCSTALHGILNGIAWLKSGMETHFLVGGSEAPLTPFTIAQAKALKIYSHLNDEFPCRALDISKTQNTMVLGEGAAVFCLEKGLKINRLASILGIGYATEKLTHNVSLSADGQCLQQSMRMAIGNFQKEEIDLIITHTPGTIKGDLSEYQAIMQLFDNQPPTLTNNKWKIGHTFGASGAFSLEMAILMLQEQQFLPVPYLTDYQQHSKKIEKILINAVGFGGNAVSILVGK